MEIVRSIKYVDAVIPQENMDKFEMWKKIKFDILFVGDDWYKTNKWQEFEKELSNVKVIYFPYTKGTSSTLLTQTLQQISNIDTSKGNN